MRAQRKTMANGGNEREREDTEREKTGNCIGTHDEIETTTTTLLKVFLSLSRRAAVTLFEARAKHARSDDSYTHSASLFLSQ